MLFISHITGKVNNYFRGDMNKILHQNFRRWKQDISDCGLTIVQFCKDYGISRRNVYNTIKNPTIKTLEEIENAIVEMKKQHKKD